MAFIEPAALALTAVRKYTLQQGWENFSLSGATHEGGDSWVGALPDVELTLSNSGGRDASSLSFPALATGYTYKGGAFPGTGGTCGSALTAGASCTVVLTFDPTSPGTYPFSGEIAFDSGRSLNPMRTAPIELVNVAVSGDAADLDLSFGTGGFVDTSPDGGSDLHYKALLQPDGKLLTGGCHYVPGSTTGFDVSIVRYNPDGSLDTSFGNGGFVRTEVGTGIDDCAGGHLALQSDGKILATGAARFGAIRQAFLGRYNTDGSLDTSFATGGMYLLDFAAQDDLFNGVVVLGDGSIIVGGAAGDGSGFHDVLFVKLDSTGTPDPAFGSSGTNGVELIVLSAGHDYVEQLALDGSGMLVAAGRTSNGADSDFLLLRMDPATGALDPTFGTGGIVTLDFGEGNDHAYGFGFQSDGRIVVGGDAISGGTSGFALARFDTEGQLDPTFGTGGTMVSVIPPGTNQGAAGIVVLDDDRIIQGGNIDIENTPDHAMIVLRYTASGQLDTTFGDDGYVTHQMVHEGGISKRQKGRGLVVDAYGKYILTGYFHDQDEHMTVARFWP